MSKEKKPTKGNHFLPITYLKHFLHNDQLVMYKKGKKFFNKGSNPTDRIVTISGEKGLSVVAKQNNLYTVKGVEGVESDFMEGYFVDLIEGKFDSLIQELDSLTFGSSISDELKKDFCILMASMCKRVPGAKKETDDLYTEFFKVYFESVPLKKEEKSAIREQIKKESGVDVSDNDLDNAISAFNEGGFNFKTSTNHFVESILSETDTFANIFYGMKMCIVRSDGGNLFITSDNPVGWHVPADKTDYHLNAPRSLMSKHTEVYFPLTKDYCVVLTRADDAHEMILPVTRAIFDRLENTLSCFSKDYIFSPVQKSILDDFANEYIPYAFELVRR
jgi:hypothetical protein